jgi:hypothetical protein
MLATQLFIYLAICFTSLIIYFLKVYLFTYLNEEPGLLSCIALGYGLRPNQAPNPGVKQPGREADHLPPSSAKDKNVCNILSIPQYAFMEW